MPEDMHLSVPSRSTEPNVLSISSLEDAVSRNGIPEENKIVRIVNLDDQFIEVTLTDFIQEKVQPNGKIQSLYLKKHKGLGISYAYVIFELGCDALKTTQILGGYIHNGRQFDVALIGPNLPFERYEYKLVPVLTRPAARQPNTQSRLQRLGLTYRKRTRYT